MKSNQIRAIGIAMTTRVLAAHVPVDLVEKVDVAAERLDRPRAWIAGLSTEKPLTRLR